MLTKNPENAMVCDPVACAEMLCKLFYLLKLAALTGVDTAVAAPKLIHGTLRQSVELTPPPRDLNSTKPAPKNPVLPDSWVGSAFCFGGCWYANAGEAAIHNLQLLVFVLPDTKDDRAWDSFPWERVGTILATHFKADLDNLYEQTKELAARVKSEHDAYGARKDQRAVAAAPVEPVKGLFSPAQLADQYKLPVDAVKKRLERYREKNHNGWIENMDVRPREPRFTYDHAAVRYILEDMKSKESRKTFSSRQRPAKKI